MEIFFFTHMHGETMMNILILIATLVDTTTISHVDIGLASVYNDRVFACPRSTYKKIRLPTCANRDLPCGTILNVKRIDSNKTARCVVADRGPYGACIPSKRNTRACGHGLRWINGRNFVRKKKPMDSANWRGILDMSITLARHLGVKDRLVPVFIWTDFANTGPSYVIPDDIDDPKIGENSSNISILTSLWMVRKYENHTTVAQSEN